MLSREVGDDGSIEAGSHAAEPEMRKFWKLGAGLPRPCFPVSPAMAPHHELLFRQSFHRLKPSPSPTSSRC